MALLRVLSETIQKPVTNQETAYLKFMGMASIQPQYLGAILMSRMPAARNKVVQKQLPMPEANS